MELITRNGLKDISVAYENKFTNMYGETTVDYDKTKKQLSKRKGL
jgi:hypothetical protein